MSGESAATLCLFAWCQAEREAKFFVEEWGDNAGKTVMFVRWWRRRSVLSADGMLA